MEVRRGEVYLADLEPSLGSEANKTRPCLVVSNDASNRSSPTVTVVPITGTVETVYSFEVDLGEELPKPSKAQANQVRTISKKRLRATKMATLSDRTMDAVVAALRLHLQL